MAQAGEAETAAPIDDSRPIDEAGMAARIDDSTRIDEAEMAAMIDDLTTIDERAIGDTLDAVVHARGSVAERRGVAARPVIDHGAVEERQAIAVESGVAVIEIAIGVAIGVVVLDLHRDPGHDDPVDPEYREFD